MFSVRNCDAENGSLGKVKRSLLGLGKSAVPAILG